MTRYHIPREIVCDDRLIPETGYPHLRMEGNRMAHANIGPIHITPAHLPLMNAR